MKAENKYRWMVWAIVVLALMNLTTFITVVYHKNQLIEKEDSALQDPGVYESASIKYSGRYFRDELGLSNEQMKQFLAFNPDFRMKVKTINQKMDFTRREMLAEMAESISDTTKLNLLSDSIGYLHSALKKSTYIFYLDFKNICNQQQQKKLEQLFGEMFNSDLQIGQNGKGGPGGRRFGWRNKN